jgi:alpha-tubulin suppressor-like RCC1 family protein
VRASATEAYGKASQTSTPTAPIAAASAPVSDSAPSVTGTELVGSVLSATPGVWSEESTTSYAYQWDRCGEGGESCASISGATASTYTLSESDKGSTLRALVTATNEGGSTTATSPATAAISPKTLVKVITPSIAGAYRLDRALVGDRGIWTGEGALTYAYQWERCSEKGEGCSSITGATEASYTPVSADVGKTLRVVITVEGTAGKETVSSAVTPAIYSEPIAPEDVFAPSIEGNLTSGETLTAQTGTWLSTEPISYSYQWQKCSENSEECHAIEGATGSTYKLIESEVNSTLRLTVTGKNTLGSATATSEQTEVVGSVGPPANTSRPLINGTSRQGESLTARNGNWSGSRPLTYYYRWERCNSAGEGCIPIEGATKPAYTTASADLGSTLRVKVTAKNSLSSAGSVSAQTGVVAGNEAGATQAIEVAEKADPSILQAASGATLEEQEVKPALSDSGESLSDTDALTTSSVSKETPGEFAVNTPDGELSFQPVNSAPNATKTPTIVNGAVAVFAGTANATDTIVRPDALGATTLVQMRSSEAPTTFSWEVGLGPNQRLEKLSNGDVAVVELPTTSPLEGSLGEALKQEPSEASAEHEGTGETGEAAENALEQGVPGEGTLEKLAAAPTASTPIVEPKAGELHPQETKAQYEAAKSTVAAAEEHTDGTTLMVVEAPKVLDAKGNTVTSSLAEEGDAITMTVSPTGGTVFPATAEVNVSAPSNAASTAKGSKVRYGLADPRPASFEESEEEGKPVPHFDKHLKEGQLHIGIARNVIPYNWHPNNTELLAWLKAVGKAGLQPYLTLRPEYSQFCNRKAKCTEPTVGSYEQHVKELIAGLLKEHEQEPSVIPLVSVWGAWNEPDLNAGEVKNPLYKNPKRAVLFWKKARAILKQVGCNCTLVAGEFAADNGYMSEYIHDMQKNRAFWIGKPHVWGFHDYQDLEDYYYHPYNSNADRFIEKLGRRFGIPRIWFTEQGVELEDQGVKTDLDDGSESEDTERQIQAAKDFLKLGSIHVGKEPSRVELVDYYLYRGPAPGSEAKPFDSGMLEGAKHEPEDWRPAYCMLALGLAGCPAPTTTLPPVPGSVTKEGDTASLAVNPLGSATKYYVEYGTTEAYGKSTATTALANEHGKQSVTVAIKALESCTTYHYQAVAENQANKEEGKPSLGGDRTFQTGGCKATAIDSADYHACALLTDSEVSCWGGDGNGELGNGFTEEEGSPDVVKGISNATAISGAGNNSCALLSTNRVDCWGENQWGQLGNDSNESSSIPVAVSGLTNATAVAAGWNTSCALLSTGHVECWGSNSSGALGDGTTTGPEDCYNEPCSKTPVPVSEITNATAIAAGYGHLCALLSTGHIECWGVGSYGDLGNGAKEGSSVPVAVSEIANATAVSVSDSGTCALLSTGHIDCWGYGLNGELGNGTFGESTTPVEVSGVTNATAISAGDQDVCARLTTGSIECWGRNNYGQLGDGTDTGPEKCLGQGCSDKPVAVSEVTNATAVSSSYLDTCALLSGGDVDCWGANEAGHLGFRETEYGEIRTLPVAVPGFP